MLILTLLMIVGSSGNISNWDTVSILFTGAGFLILLEVLKLNVDYFEYKRDQQLLIQEEQLITKQERLIEVKKYHIRRNRNYARRRKMTVSYTHLDVYKRQERYISLDDMSAGMLAKSILGEDEAIINTSLERVFPVKIVKNFPVGSIFELRLETQVSRSLYQSNKNGNLVKSRYEYPVTY
nr:hypothetical protein A5881_002971 [Enterococcus termitis]